MLAYTVSRDMLKPAITPGPSSQRAARVPAAEGAMPSQDSPRDTANPNEPPMPGKRVGNIVGASPHSGVRFNGFMQRILNSAGATATAKYWLISAYNPETNSNGTIEQCGAWKDAQSTCYDYTKLAAISGIAANTTQNPDDPLPVPEPSSLLLLSLGLILLKRNIRQV